MAFKGIELRILATEALANTDQGMTPATPERE